VRNADERLLQLIDGWIDNSGQVGKNFSCKPNFVLNSLNQNWSNTLARK